MRALRRCCWMLPLLVAGFAASTAGAADTTQANSALQQGRLDEAAAMLHRVLQAQPKDDLAHQLLCRVFYAQDMGEAAVHECELAVADGANTSDNHLWLGRAYGMRASQVSPFSAFGLAKKVREQFEKAVELNPDSTHAASDLGQFYISAPGIAGGGTDKAMALIQRIEPKYPLYSHRLRGLLAEKKKDLPLAEAEFKASIAAGKSLGALDAAAWIDLAEFYQRHGRLDQAVDAIQSSLALNPKGSELPDAAGILIATHHSPELAERLLREYLASGVKTDESPAPKVHVQLGELLKQRGDTAGAQAQFRAAVALAATWAPARKALQT